MKVSIIYKNGKKVCQKITIHNDDLWNGDHTLALIIYPFLKKYNSQKLESYPSLFIQDYNNRNEEVENIEIKEWKNVLNKMIFSFECIATHKTYITEIENCFEWTEELVQKQLEHEKRIQEGLELFGKYFQSLWI